MEQVKCAHEPCTCTVDAGEQYCSHVCKQDAVQSGLSPASCRCGHPSCEQR